jgi:pilus assembly protein CpaB
VSGFITPGDAVDVMLAADLAHTLDGTRQAASENHSAPPSQRLARYAAETVLRNVRVLAIDQQIARAADGGAVQGKTATLAVTPKQAEALAVAALLGPLQLMLRGQAEDPKNIAKGFSGDIETSQALRSLTGAPSADHVVINRAGTVSIEDFSR